ncbi:hypothetical protein SPURM210S_02402 [Streptomyces purpurascens]
MSIRFTAKARRGMVALTAAAGLALGVAGCGGGGDNDDKSSPSASASKDSGSKPSAQEGQSGTPLAELKGTNGLLLQITSAARDSGGLPHPERNREKRRRQVRGGAPSDER